jgi:hypothetical protein
VECQVNVFTAAGKKAISVLIFINLVNIDVPGKLALLRVRIWEPWGMEAPTNPRKGDIFKDWEASQNQTDL